MWMKFKTLKSFVNKQLRESKANYFRNLIKKNNGNSAELWKTLNEVTRTQSFVLCQCIEKFTRSLARF